MPKLWTDTVETHRREVRDAIVDTAAELIAREGLLAVTMSSIAETTGIGRATLYKYFPDVESILVAWHQRQISAHLQQLVEASEHAGSAAQRLRAVLETFAQITHESRGHGDSELAAMMHRDPHLRGAERQLHHLVQGLVADAAAGGAVRQDIPPTELAEYCLRALTSASALPSKAAVRRLVTVTLSGLQANA